MGGMGATTGFKKDFTKSTSSPSPTGERVHALTKQTPVKNDFTKFTSSPSPNGEEIPVRKDFTKSTSSPSPTGEKLHALTKQTLQANSQQKEKNVVSAEAARGPVATGGPIFADVSIETSRRPFVKKWYNHELKKQDRETWDMFDGCFGAIQTSNDKAAKYWLSRLEKSHLSLKERFGEVQQLVSRLLSFSSTSRSDFLKTKEEDLFSETSSEEQRNLKSIYTQLQTADLVNLRIDDFLELH